ncbi:LytR cell envelope-related transcriptional attenuator [Blastococcus aurantiacus]|uniref:LytR cell envelope-related transcriptional attenuator n=1 Tax=Blastococcus aurantiacus TaxID=1550231 RepID=A0A1G7JYD1_9ACTN|nr:LytR C-terminal domain-containing protein [Blastococcus aurantiacus]SDF29852.1 LytR cell envelope-related transcriptional attenuator [Blastococcus aurantiacus]
MWRGVPDARLSDHPTAPGRERARLEPTPPRRPTAAAVAKRPADPGAPVSRSRLPLPPVPVSARPSAPLEERAGALAESLRAAEAAAARRKRVWADDDAEPLSTGPTGIGSGAPAPRLPRQTSGASDSRYGDWTKPSRSGELPSEEEMRAALTPAPSTSLIPERSVAQRDEDIPDLEGEFQARPVRSSSRSAVGGRAALRAERQAADEARRKAAKDSGVALLDDEPRRAPRRVAKGLVAMGVVALGVLGVYQVTSPKADEASAVTRNTPATTSVAPVTPLPPLPELDTGEATAPVEEVAPSTPVRVPVTVLNATDITGLAAKISGAVVGGGWEAAGVGAYEGDDVAASTVYYTEGDETQRQAALQLIDQFPQLQGPALRFFDLPADVTTPGLVVVAAGEWTP